MNIIDRCYHLIATEFNTDTVGAKETISQYIEKLKAEIDTSDDEKAKQYWYEEFGNDSYPTPEEFIALLFVIGKNPFKPKK